MQFPIYQVDAFADALFSGNPAAVVPLDAWLPDAVMQAVAAENNLSETAFFVPRDDDGFDLRWFTPLTEVDLCGHATLATAHVLYSHLGYEGARAVFHTRSGALRVERAGHGYRMDFPADEPVRMEASEIVSRALGAEVAELWRGRDDFMAVLDTQKQIEQLQPDMVALAQLGGRGLIATAPGDTADFVSRCFYPNAGIAEDPATGSAHTTLTPYWAARTGKSTLRARQLSARGADLLCFLAGNRVVLEGSAVTYMWGACHV
jgi:PhzF family phenazine biosynthesis protein